MAASDSSRISPLSSCTRFMNSGVSVISANLQPTYIKLVPTTDGWNWNIQYGSTSGGSAYTVRSLGKDGTKNGTGGLTSDFNCDIIFQAGAFAAYPSGVQT